MNTTIVRIAVCGLFVLGGLVSPAAAQKTTPRPAAMPARPAPSPSPTPLAFTARAHADITVVTADRTIDGKAVLGMSQRANLTRVDVISVTTDAIPLPPISVSFVVDRNARTVTSWSAATKQYYVQRMSPAPSPGPTPAPKPLGLFAGTSPFAKLDVLDVSIKLTGHTTTAGIATTGLLIDGHFAKKGSTNVAHATVTTQLADDFGAFPLTIDASLEPGAPSTGVTSPASVKLSYAVDELTRALPAAAGFRVPAGYRRATSMLAVIFPGQSSAPTSLRRPRPRPRLSSRVCGALCAGRAEARRAAPCARCAPKPPSRSARTSIRAVSSSRTRRGPERAAPDRLRADGGRRIAGARSGPGRDRGPSR